MSVLWHQSGVNLLGEPFVQLFVDDKAIGQFTPQEVREHAMAILETAEAAEQDSLLMRFLREKIGSSVRDLAIILQELRAYREQAGKKGPNSDKKEFVITDEHKKPGEGKR